MSVTVNRRTFLRRLLALSAGGAALTITGCGGRRAPTEPTPAPALSVPTEAPTAVPPSPAPTAVPPTLAPAATATAIPASTVTSTVEQQELTVAASATPAPTITPAGTAYLAAVHGPDLSPAELTKRAIAAVGGIERFVKKGDDVIVKPNMCTSYYGPEYASTTNPEVVATIVALCLGAGARRVRVMDYPFGGSAKNAYVTSGISEAVSKAGGEMELMAAMKYRNLTIPKGKALKQIRVYGDIMDANVVINVPIAKDHGSSTLTLGMKNLMGVVWERPTMHSRGLHQSIADLSSVVRPQLTVVDAVRILTANGPTGGNLDDVKKMDTVIASADVVAADAYATRLFNMRPEQIPYIKYGAEMGLGTMDLSTVKVDEIAG